MRKNKRDTFRILPLEWRRARWRSLHYAFRVLALKHITTFRSRARQGVRTGLSSKSINGLLIAYFSTAGLRRCSRGVCPSPSRPKHPQLRRDGRPLVLQLQRRRTVPGVRAVQGRQRLAGDPPAAGFGRSGRAGRPEMGQIHIAGVDPRSPGLLLQPVPRAPVSASRLFEIPQSLPFLVVIG
jgi:hypothetical protein